MKACGVCKEVFRNHYQEDGKIASQKFPDGSFSYFQYLIMVVNPSGRVMTNRYNSRSCLFSSTDSESKEYTRDFQANRITSCKDKLQRVTRYEYDSNGNRTLVEGTTVLKVHIEYDPAGRRTVLVRPNGIVTRYSCDAGGRLLSVVHDNISGI